MSLYKVVRGTAILYSSFNIIHFYKFSWQTVELECCHVTLCWRSYDTEKKRLPTVQNYHQSPRLMLHLQTFLNGRHFVSTVPCGWYTADAGREAQVLPITWGVHFCCSQSVSGHCQYVSVHTVHRWQCSQVKYVNDWLWH